MAEFKQQFLKPGQYKGGHILTADDLRAVAENTNRALAGGLYVPVLDRHAKPGSNEGGPQFSATKAKGTDNVGWLKRIDVDADGALSHVLDLTDRKAEQKAREGSIKFSSPEIARHVDGKNRDWGRMIRHVALTPTPRNPDQQPLAEVLQMSLDDYEGPIQMADNPFEKKDGEDDTEKKSESDKGEDTSKAQNPDMPTADGMQQKSQAIIALLSELGAELPSDFELTGLDEGAANTLLAAMKTAARAKADAEAAKNPEPDANPDLEKPTEATGMQFSEDEINAMTPREKKLWQLWQATNEKVVQFSEREAAQQHDQSKVELLAKIQASKIPPKQKQKLRDAANALQFSDGDDGLARVTDHLAVLTDAFAGMPATMQFAESETKEASEPEISKSSDDRPTGDAAAKIAEEVVQSTGYAPRRTTWTNPEPQSASGGTAVADPPRNRRRP